MTLNGSSTPDSELKAGLSQGQTLFRNTLGVTPFVLSTPPYSD